LNDPTSAIKFVQWLQDDGLDWNAVNWSFAWGLRNYLFVLDYVDHWITDSKQIATELKQNPWVIMNIQKKYLYWKKKEIWFKNCFKVLWI
jgi:hypothetical protein